RGSAVYLHRAKQLRRNRARRSALGLLPLARIAGWLRHLGRSFCRRLVRSKLRANQGIAEAGGDRSVPLAELRGIYEFLCAEGGRRPARGALRCSRRILGRVARVCRGG